MIIEGKEVINMKTEAFKGTFGDFAEATDGADARGMDNAEIGDGKVIGATIH